MGLSDGSLGPEVHRGARGWESEDQRVPFRKSGERHPHSTKDSQIIRNDTTTSETQWDFTPNSTFVFKSDQFTIYTWQEGSLDPF